MRRKMFLIAWALAAVLPACPGSFRLPASPSTKTVVVELFTSEGCSSCPPADTLLGQLRQGPQPGGKQAITLGFHVDYWNGPGWRDRFSSPAYSRRQDEYAHRFKLDGPYTPQMVVDGRTEFVGSDLSRAKLAIAEASSQPALAGIELTLLDHDRLKVDVGSAPTQSAGVWLAITEDALSTDVRGGENGGHVLGHSAVVRDFRKVGELSGGKFQAELTLNLGKDWKRRDLRAVILVEEPNAGPILGAASSSLARPTGVSELIDLGHFLGKKRVAGKLLMQTGKDSARV